MTTQTTTQQQKALAPSGQGQAIPGGLAPRTSGPSAPLVPTNLGEAMQLADALSRSSIIPKAYQGNPGNILSAIILAQELELSPLLVMREVYFINDRPSLYAELKVALVMRDSACEYFRCTETTAKSATYVTKRRGDGEPTKLTVNLSEIPQALIQKNPTWQQYPANMLRWRCAGWLCDMVYPDRVLGLKTREEMEDVVDLERQGAVYAPPPPAVQAAAAAPAASASVVVVEATPATSAQVASAPEPLEVVLAELELADTTEAIDALSKRLGPLLGKDHPRRREVGEKFSARRKAVAK